MCQPGRPAPQGDSHCGSSGFDMFPQDKIEGITFAFINFYTYAGLQILAIFMRQLSVVVAML